MKKYVVTGAAGFIGSTVATKLLQNGHSVIGIDCINDAYDTRVKHWRLGGLNEYERFKLNQLDISIYDAEWVSEFDRADSVIHLAARAGVRQSVLNPRVYMSSNVDGTLNVLEAMRENNLKSLVMASTSSLYGANTDQPYNEESDSSRTLSPYAASKKGAEALVYTYHHLYGFDTQILRFFTVYGPAGRPDMSIFKFVQAVIEGSELNLYGDGGERDFTYVDDIASGVILATEQSGHNIINLGGDNPVKIKQIIEIIEDITGLNSQVRVVERDPSDVPSTWADITRAKDILNWTPYISIEEGIKSAVDWYMANRDWAKTVQ
tara:strand:- start:211 stop:1173 length:963 start_codon:yes stop_codon:yes gene_type:complete